MKPHAFSASCHAGATCQEPQRRIRLLDSHHPRRRDAENWIRSIYLHAYQARLRRFHPWLLAVTKKDGRLASVAGFRPAGNGPLFSECYLDLPAEELLATPRREIVEVGNLAPASPGQARTMITTMTAFLHGAGFRQVIFTAVPQLYNAFRRLGLEPRKLAPALACRLPKDADYWGSYYDAGPRVYSGSILSGYRALHSHEKASGEITIQALEEGRRHRPRFQEGASE